MHRKITLLLICLMLFGASYAQKVTFQGYYHMLDSSELFAPAGPAKFTSTPPPTGTVRAIAEWEPMQAVLVCIPSSGGSPSNGIPYSMMADMSHYTPVIIIVESSAHQTSVTTSLNSAGATMSNVSFIIAALDSYWVRDYGPWFIMVNNNEVAIIDFPYNRTSRPNDNLVPEVMATHLSMDIYGMNVIHTGGNYMNTGTGVAAMTDLVEDENSLSHAQIDTAFKQYMGITNNYITTDPLGDYIKHIDCWGKFLDVDKILIASVPVSNPQYSEYEAMATYWANEVSTYGNNYQVYRVYEQYGQPYSNALILNKRVYIPFVSGTGSSYNTTAQQIYQNAMPGYTIVGITSTSWESTDALHCRTHEIADKYMLYIQHQPLLGSQPNLSQFTVNANIYNLSGSNLISDSVWIRYKVNNGSWTKILMSHPSGNLWSANIPQQTPGDTVRYYIHAADLSPRSVNHPLIGEPDPHKFWITASVAVEEQEQEQALVFPNPAYNELFIQMRNSGSPQLLISLLNAVGETVMNLEAPNTDRQMLKLDVSSYPAGSYFLRIESGENVMMKKIMIMR